MVRHRQSVLRTAFLAITLLTADRAFAQADLTGTWRPLARNEDGSGMIGDAAGLPITQSSRWRADSWSPEDFDVTEWACRPHAWHYSLETVLTQMRIWADIDRETQRVTAYHGHLIRKSRKRRSGWTDGRIRRRTPCTHGAASRPASGTATNSSSRHAREGDLHPPFGMMHSDQATIRTRWRRMGEYLQATVIIYDPINFTEPYIRSSMMWVNDPSW
jgi:hypothetical protein